MKPPKCLNCGDDDCLVNENGICPDCQAEIYRENAILGVEYQENTPEPISGIDWR